LFFLGTTENEVLSVTFDNERKLLERCRRADQLTSTIQPTTVFAPNDWYHFALTIDAQSCCVSSEGIRIAGVASKTPFRFHGMVEKALIAKFARPGSALRRNLTCVYLFSDSLSPEVIQALSLLPNDFCIHFHQHRLFL
jgi:hypothetical protein